MTLNQGTPVIAIRDLGGGIFERHVPQGTPGVVTRQVGFFSDSYDVTFTLPGGFFSSEETVKMTGLTEKDVRRR